MKKRYLLALLVLPVVLVFKAKNNESEVKNLPIKEELVLEKAITTNIKQDLTSRKNIKASKDVENLEKEIEEFEKNNDIEDLLTQLNDERLNSSERKRIIDSINKYTIKMAQLAQMEEEKINREVR